MLDQATRAGRLTWQPCASTDSFKVQLGDGYLVIGLKGLTDRPTLTAFNKNGAICDEAFGLPVENLFGAARRSALKFDELIESMLTALLELNESTRCPECGGEGRVKQHWDPATDTLRGGYTCPACKGDDKP